MNVSILESRKMILGAASAAAALAILLVSAPARADAQRADALGGSEVSHLKVHFADLDANSQSDTRRLYMRLRIAAEIVCGADEPGPQDLMVRGKEEQCVQESIADAVERIDRPLLTALYDKRYPRAPIAVAMNTSASLRG